MKKVLLTVLVWCCYLVSLQAQENFPAVTIKSTSGKEADFSKLMTQSGDTVIIVSFWATWCVPCITELDNINDQYKEWQAAKPFKLVAVSIDDSRTSQRVRPFVKGKGWVFDVYLDVNHDLKRALNINDVPHILVIKNNRVVYQHTGYIAGNEDELFEKIKAL
jgi:thiol-disulfide isomerase/thioredoxin